MAYVMWLFQMSLLGYGMSDVAVSDVFAGCAMCDVMVSGAFAWLWHV